VIALAFVDDAVGAVLFLVAPDLPATATRLVLVALTAVWPAGRAGPRTQALHVLASLGTVALAAGHPHTGGLDVAVAGLLAVTGGVALARTQVATVARARADAALDPLTGLLNRRGLAGWADGQSRDTAVAVVTFDVDGLKSLNDRDGHAGGDEALAAVALSLAAECRSGQAAARLGGDEFVLVAPAADLDAARAVARRVERAVVTEAAHRGVGLSAGSSAGRLADLDQLVAGADRALYDGRRGRRPAS
jgi:diguanylate cyclase (GGDEF)-like protein